MMATNLETAHASLRALLPGMVARRRGSVVVIGSRAVERPWTSASASGYAASKAAVVALAQTVAAEVLESGVRLNAVLPSTLDTAANRRAMPAADPARWVTPESAADVIAFLLSDQARDVSGAAIPVYGRA
jgi:NAD(P)-dependent dehydrogenase (short-subunit alcohol dehydrogenase family)